VQFLARIRRRRVLVGVVVLSAALTTPAAALVRTGWAPPTSPVQATATPSCTAGSPCVTVDATRILGPVDLVAQGFLLGVAPSSDPATITALRPTSWRLAGDATNYAVARASGATVTEILSNQWPGTQGPWDDWSGYAQWVRQTVTASISSGEVPDYWEIQNEPDSMIGNQPVETTAQALYQYQLASSVIRSVDPLAKIEGPSLLGYFDTPGQSTVDMATFLAFVNAHQLPLDALSWHEVIGPAVERSPAAVVSDVRRARALLSQYPAYAGVPIFINEYSPKDTHLIPGWAVGWMDSLEAAGVAEATVGCWHELDASARMISECAEGGLDGLLQPGSGQPQDLYWVHSAYAQMTGERVATSSTDPNISAYATYDAAAGTIQVLIGRHVSCTRAVRTECSQPASATPAPEPVTLRVKAPTGWTVLDASSQRIPNVPGPMASPPSTDHGLFLAPQISIPLAGGRFADGDAYALKLTGL